MNNKMITVQEADQLLHETLPKRDSMIVPLSEALDTIIAEDIYSDREMPPFNRVAMDGISIDYHLYQQGKKSFSIEGIQKAGDPILTLSNENNCFEVMTGAVLPENTDTVIRVEDLTIENNTANIRDGVMIKKGQNVHLKGTDVDINATLIHIGTKINATHIGILASVGKEHVTTFQFPKVAIISTGNELVEVSETPLPHQIRRSNVYVIQAGLNKLGPIQTTVFHLKDDKESIQSNLEKILLDYDAIILSGGVSMGKFDFIPESLKVCGVQEIFHKIQQKPGKPFWYGMKGDSQRVYALPGNPVSALVCLYRYVIPHILKSLNISELPKYHSINQQEIKFKKSLVLFQPVKINSSPEGLLEANIIKGNGSGDYSSLAQTSGFIQISPNDKDKSIGSSLPYYPWTIW